MLRPPHLCIPANPQETSLLLDLILIQVARIRPGRAKLRVVKLQLTLRVRLEHLLRLALPVLRLLLPLLQIGCHLRPPQLV